MTLSVKLKTIDGMVDIPLDQIWKYQMISSLHGEIMAGKVFEKSPILVLNVVNFPKKCFEAVVRYTTYICERKIVRDSRELEVDTAEAEIVHNLTTIEEVKDLFSTAQYLGNEDCMQFAARVLLNRIVHKELYKDQSVPETQNAHNIKEATS